MLEQERREIQSNLNRNLVEFRNEYQVRGGFVTHFTSSHSTPLVACSCCSNHHPNNLSLFSYTSHPSTRVRRTSDGGDWGWSCTRQTNSTEKKKEKKKIPKFGCLFDEFSHDTRTILFLE